MRALIGSCWVYRLNFGSDANLPPGPVEDNAAGIGEAVSPRHADVLLVCGDCAGDDVEKLRQVWVAMPGPKLACLLRCPGGRLAFEAVDRKAKLVELTDGADLARAVCAALARPAEGKVTK
jgi:hypothetical protein